MSETTRPRRRLPIAEDVPAGAVAPAPAAEAPLPEPHEETFSAIFGTCKRQGDWYVADRLVAWSVFGEVLLDFTAADLPGHGQVEVDCNAILGEVTLVVPRDAEIDLSGTHAILGDIDVTDDKPGAVRSFVGRLLGDDPEEDELFDDEDEPLRFQVSGSVLLGSLKVKRV